MDNFALHHDQALWRAVVGQAITDATSTSTDTIAKRERRRARNWLTWSCFDQDFRQVCSLADLEPDVVRAFAFEQLRQPPVDRRRTSGNGKIPKLIAFNGEELTIRQWAERLGLSRAAIFARLKKGWSIEEALSEPSRRGRGKPGVVDNFRKSIADRSIPVAQESA